MVNFPFYSQLDFMDCGPTCLRMIAKHYGRSLNIQSLREKSQVGKDGVSLLGIAEAAEIIGFRSLGVKLTFDKFVKQTNFPCIIHWNQNHFVVVYSVKRKEYSWLSKIRGGRNSFLDLSGSSNHINLMDDRNEFNAYLDNKWTIHVADPSKGLISYTEDEFCKGWLTMQGKSYGDGIVLLLEPTPLFFDQKEDSGTSVYGFNKVINYLLRYKNLLIQLFLGLLVGSSLQLIFPFLTQSIVDVGINTKNIGFIYLVLIAQLMLMTGRLFIEFIRSWILMHISIHINLSVISDFLIKLTKLPASFFESKQFGDLMQRINDHQKLDNFLTGQALSVLFSVISLLLLGIVLITYSVKIFFIFLFSSIFYVFWIIIFLKHRRKLDFKRFHASSKSNSNIIQLIQGMREIKLAGAERPMRWEWERLQSLQFKLQMKNLSLNQLQQIGIFSINEGKNIFITFLSAQAVINGQLTLGAMLAMQQILGQLNSPVEQLIGFIQGLQDAKISLERLNEIHSLEDEEPNNGILLKDLPKVKYLQLKDLSFTYAGAGNEPVLHKINLTIPEGKTTAIVGMSGSGKTTILKILLKFYEPTNGNIRLGNISLRNVSHAFWRSQCGVVMQDGFIFSDSIARNIAVGVERIDMNKLHHSIDLANLTEFVDSLPTGYHTKIGSEGNGISQGQMQRILIARAVYKDPSFIFFDEATNALDATNEAEIMNKLNSFFLGRTVVVVAHRLSTVKSADQIVVLNKGVITELGSHDHLISKKGDYWRLVKNQLELGS